MDVVILAAATPSKLRCRILDCRIASKLLLQLVRQGMAIEVALWHRLPTVLASRSSPSGGIREMVVGVRLQRLQGLPGATVADWAVHLVAHSACFIWGLSDRWITNGYR